MRIRVAGVTIAVLAVVAYAAPPRVSADPVATTALVLKVVDGDIIDIRDDNRVDFACGSWESTHRKRRSKPGFTIRCWGAEATEFADSTMLGQRVAPVTDPTQDGTDRYGRTLAYLVRADGWDYSVEAARAGTAHSYFYGGRPVSRHDAIAGGRKRSQRLASRAVGSAV
jgi:micrococcal nuclease